MNKPTLHLPYSASHPSHQRGASVSGIVFLILALGIMVKLGLAIVPAMIGDYQATKLIAAELKKANDSKSTSKQFMDNLTAQWNINSYHKKPDEVFTIIDNNPGSLKVRKDYTETSNFYGNVDIVSHFKGDITAADAK